MESYQDFSELLELLNATEVEYLVVGGYAVAHHGHPRYTRDLDLFVHTSPDNARRIVKVLGEFGFGAVGLTEEDFASPNRVVQLGQPPIRIDFVTSLDGVNWDEAWATRTPGRYGAVDVNYISKDQLISNKRAVGRLQDLADVEALQAGPGDEV